MRLLISETSYSRLGPQIDAHAPQLETLVMDDSGEVALGGQPTSLTQPPRTSPGSITIHSSASRVALSLVRSGPLSNSSGFRPGPRAWTISNGPKSHGQVREFAPAMVKRSVSPNMAWRASSITSRADLSIEPLRSPESGGG